MRIQTTNTKPSQTCPTKKHNKDNSDRGFGWEGSSTEPPNHPHLYQQPAPTKGSYSTPQEIAGIGKQKEGLNSGTGDTKDCPEENPTTAMQQGAAFTPKTKKQQVD
jgi:hypothetical protein